MNCIICLKSNFELLWTNPKNSNVRFQKEPRDVLICMDCGLVTLDVSKINEKVLQDYYQVYNPFEKPGKLPESHKNMRDEQINWILKNIPKSSKIQSVCDIGCGSGYLMKLFKDKKYKITGIDYSPLMIKEIKKNYRINAIQGKFDSKSFKEKFDLITSSNVIEHLYDPKIEIGIMSNLINENGYLFIEVPDTEFPVSDTIVDVISFEHITHFTKNTLCRFLENFNLKIITTNQKTYSQGSGMMGSYINVLAQKCSLFKKKYNQNEYVFQKRNLFSYKKNHTRYIDNFQKKINKIAKEVNSEPVAIFPSGEHTAKLIERCDFGRINLHFLFDNDNAVVGKKLFGLKIKHSSEIDKIDVKNFILSTTNHEHSIYNQIKTINSNFKVFGLYSKFDG